MISGFSLTSSPPPIFKPTRSSCVMQPALRAFRSFTPRQTIGRTVRTRILYLRIRT